MQNTVTQLVKIPPAFTSRLDSLYVDASEAVKQMLADRKQAERAYREARER